MRAEVRLAAHAVCHQLFETTQWIRRSSGPDELAFPSALSAARSTWPSAHGSPCQHGSDRSRLCGRTSSTADNDAAWRNLSDLESRKMAILWRSARKASVSQKPHPSCGFQRTPARITYRQKTTRRVILRVIFGIMLGLY